MGLRSPALALAVLSAACGGGAEPAPAPGEGGPTSTAAPAPPVPAPPPPDPTGPELDQRTARERHLMTAGPDLATVAAGEAVRGGALAPFVLAATDSDSPCSSLEFAADGLPEGLEVTNNGDCTATVSGTVRAPEGSYVVRYTVTDDMGGSDVSVATFVVQPRP